MEAIKGHYMSGKEAELFLLNMVPQHQQTADETHYSYYQHINGNSKNSQYNQEQNQVSY